MRFSKEQPQGLLSTVNYALIIYICAFLAAGPFVGSLSARITPKPTEEEVALIAIKRGDTLWDLAIKYFQDPFLWKEFKKYNKFTNPDLIYPGEKLQLPEKIVLPTGVAREIESEIIATMGATKADLDKLREEYDQKVSEFKSATKDVRNIEKTLAKLKRENQTLKKQLKQRKNQLQKLFERIKEQSVRDEKAQKQIGELESSLTSQQAERKSVQQKINKLEESLAERSKQMETREEEVLQLSKEIKDHTQRLAATQENIVKLRKEIEKAEVDFAEEAEKPASEKESKLAVAATIAGGIVLFVVSVLAR